MKKTLFIVAIATFAILTGCKTEPKEYVFLGQLYMAWDHAGQEKIKGKVKEFKQTHFWANEENGKVVRGKVLTIKERESLANMGRDMTEEFNESGTVLRSTTFNEDGKPLQDIKVTAEGKIITGSEYYVNDTLRAKIKYKYDGNNLAEFTAYRPVADTLMMRFKYGYDQNGFIDTTWSYNFKNELQSYTARARNEKGQVLKAQNFNKDGKVTSQVEYTYNEKGERHSQHQQILTTGQVIDYTFAYEYDTMGNYKAIIFIKDGKPLIYRAREIKYYD